jgi:hypothetical protein
MTMINRCNSSRNIKAGGQQNQQKQTGLVPEKKISLIKDESA